MVPRRPRLGIWGRLMKGLEGPLWLGRGGEALQGRGMQVGTWGDILRCEWRGVKGAESRSEHSAPPGWPSARGMTVWGENREVRG